MSHNDGLQLSAEATVLQQTEDAVRLPSDLRSHSLYQVHDDLRDVAEDEVFTGRGALALGRSAAILAAQCVRKTQAALCRLKRRQSQ